jgi:hypothetical protein
VNNEVTELIMKIGQHKHSQYHESISRKNKIGNCAPFALNFVIKDAIIMDSKV